MLPSLILKQALTLLDKVDCDPASPLDDNEHLIIPAVAHLGDGLNMKWAGNVLLYPPDRYSDWVQKIIYERKCGNVANALVILPAITTEGWSQRLLAAYPTCFVKDYNYLISYLGLNIRRFDSCFSHIGVITIAY